jgi:hypothetical protein
VTFPWTMSGSMRIIEARKRYKAGGKKQCDPFTIHFLH